MVYECLTETLNIIRKGSCGGKEEDRKGNGYYDELYL